MSTKLRIALLAGLLAFASNLLIIGFIHFQTRDEIVSELRHQVAEQSAALNQIYKKGGAAALKREIAEATDADDPQTALAIIDRSGTPVFGNVDSLLAPDVDAFTRSTRPAWSATIAMMSSAALPNVALRSPPSVGPERAAICSVASPMKPARGSTPRHAATNTRMGEACM